MKEEYLYEELDAYLSNFEGKLSQEEIGRLRLVAEHFYLCGENPNVNLMPQLPANLDDAAENYIAPIENEEGRYYINFCGRDIKDAFIAGAEWQKEQMLQLAKNRYEVVMSFGTGNPDVDHALQMDRLTLVKIIEEDKK